MNRPHLRFILNCKLVTLESNGLLKWVFPTLLYIHIPLTLCLCYTEMHKQIPILYGQYNKWSLSKQFYWHSILKVTCQRVSEAHKIAKQCALTCSWLSNKSLTLYFRLCPEKKRKNQIESWLNIICKMQYLIIEKLLYDLMKKALLNCLFWKLRTCYYHF